MSEQASKENSIQTDVASTPVDDPRIATSELTALSTESLNWVAGGPHGTIIITN